MVRALFLSLVLALGLSGLPLEAQDAKSGIRVRFVAQRLPRGLGEVVMVTEEDRSDPFALPVNNLSVSQKAPARGFVLQPVGEKKLVLAKVVLPENGRDFIVLLVLGEKSGFKPIILPAADLSFKPGDVYLHNTSKETVLGQVGTSKFVVSPSKGKIVRPAGAKEGRFYDVAFGVREKSGNRLISTTRWPVEERIRSYVFFFDDPKRKDVDFRAIDEFVPLEKKNN